MRAFALSLAAFATVALASAAAAQASVWTVDDDGGADFTEIAAAVAAASDGDVVLVRDGTYEAFVLDGRSLVVASEAGAQVFVTSSAVGATGLIEIRNVAASQSVTLRGIDVQKTFTRPYRALAIDACAGAVRIEDCTFAPAPQALDLAADTTALEVVRIADSAAVALTRCTVVAGPGFGIGLGGQTDAGPAATASASSVAVYECSFEGGRGADGYQTPTDLIVPPSPGGDGFVQDGGVLFASDTAFVGGDGGDGVTGFGCSGSGDGGAGLRVSPSGTTAVLAFTFVGGQPGVPGAGCAPGSPGPTFVPGATFDTLATPARSLVSNGPVREGQVASLSSVGVETELVFLLAGLAIHQPALALNGTLLVSPFLVEPIGTIPAGGALATQIPIGPFANPALAGFALHLQAAHVQVAPTAMGGIQVHVALSSPTALVLLDQAIP